MFQIFYRLFESLIRSLLLNIPDSQFSQILHFLYSFTEIIIIQVNITFLALLIHIVYNMQFENSYQIYIFYNPLPIFFRMDLFDHDVIILIFSLISFDSPQFFFKVICVFINIDFHPFLKLQPQKLRVLFLRRQQR